MDHVVTNNINTNKDQLNDAIYNEPTFDTSRFNSSSGTRDPLLLVTVTLRGGKKLRATIFSGITCLWGSKANNSMINQKHTKHCERKMRSNKVEYITADGMYCTTHDVPEFSSSKIIDHCFHVNKIEGGLGIGYDMIIGSYLMVQLCLAVDFKRQVLQWDGATLYMKEPRGLLGKSNLTKRKICEVLMHTAEADSTQEST